MDLKIDLVKDRYNTKLDAFESRIYSVSTVCANKSDLDQVQLNLGDLNRTVYEQNATL